MSRLAPLGMGLVAGALMVATGACSGKDAASRGSATTVPKAATTAPAQSAPGSSGSGASAPGSPAPGTGSSGSAAPGGPDAVAPAAGVAAAELGKVVVVASVPATVARGQVATATFRTRPGTSCQLDVRYASGPGTDSNQRLSPVTADAGGDVSWTWTVSGAAAPGDAAADVVCSGGAKGQARITVS
jgi:hypothetical protein